VSSVADYDPDICQHVADGSGRCTRPAQWQVYIGNGDRSYFACGVHLTKIAQAKHDDAGCTLMRQEMHLVRLKRKP
jgi:hypothetical protein